MYNSTARADLTNAMWLLETFAEVAGATGDAFEPDPVLGVTAADIVSAARQCIQSAWMECEGWPNDKHDDGAEKTMATVRTRMAIADAKLKARANA